jgi:hypothetical protein
MNQIAPERWIVSMMASLMACIGFAAAAQTSPSGPEAMPEMVHKPEQYDHMTTEPRAVAEPPRGLLHYDLDSAYLPDVVGGYVEIVVGSDSSTVTAESQQVLREIATLLKERTEIDVWVTAELETDSQTEMRETALAVQAVAATIEALAEEEDVPYRIWQKDEQRPETPINVLEIRVMTSVAQPVS